MTTKTLQPSDADTIVVLRLLAEGRSIEFAAAANPHLSADDVREIAQSHGYPNKEHLEWGIDVIQKRVDSADVDALPPATRTPSPPDAPLRSVTTQPAQPPPATGNRHRVASVVRVPVGDLRASPNNARERMTEIPELAASMREIGLLQPIVAQRLDDGTLQIVAGHRRHEAAKLLGWPAVDVIVRKPMLPDVELLAMLIENGQRAGLDPIEEARALMRLKTLEKLSDQALAKRVGRAQPTVSARLALLSLPPDEQEQIRTGEITISAGIEKARLASGRVRPAAVGRKSPQYLSAGHPLALLAQNRCRRLEHKRKGAASVGGMACGECWESVIRADERSGLHEQSAAAGSCVLCKTPHPREAG